MNKTTEMPDTFKPLGQVAAPIIADLANRVIQRIPITSREQWLEHRKSDVTASVAGALLGIHEFTTAYGLWALKSGVVAEDPEETGPMKRGRLLEPVAVELLREKKPDWEIERGTVYLRDPDARLGATPDVFANDPVRGPGVVQIKSVEQGVYSRKWKDAETGEIKPPLWIVVQAIVEAYLSGAKWAAVAPLVVGFGVDLEIIEIPIHAGILERLKTETAVFWKRVKENNPPPLDYARDGELIARLFDGVEGEVVDLSADNELPELIADRDRLTDERKRAEERLKEIKAALTAKLSAAGATSGRIGDGRFITAKTVHRKGYSVNATSYLDVRVSKLKENAA